MKTKILICIIASGFTIFGQSVHTVPDNYSSILEALNVCEEGDTVLVRDGTYSTNVIWPRVNDITLISENGPENTGLDGGVNQRIITFLESTDSISVNIIGFTFLNGKDKANGAGNAIYLHNVNLRIEECIFEDYLRNSIDDTGSIFYIDNLCNVAIYNTIFQRNKMNLISTRSKLKINNSIIRDNTGFWIFTDSRDSITINKSEIYKNIFDYPVGSFLKVYGTTDIINSLIYSNKVKQGDKSNPSLTSILIDNIRCGKVSLINSDFVNNSFDLNWEEGWITDTRCNFISLTDNEIEIHNCNFSGNLLPDSVDISNLDFQFNLIYSSNVDFGPEPVLVRNSIFSKSNSDIVINTNQPNSQIENSLFERNKIAAHLDPPIKVNNSTLVFNEYGIRNSVTTSFVDARDNYWGSEIGPQNDYENPNGNGDSTDYFVNVLPYLTTPSLDTPPQSIENLELIENNSTSIKIRWQERFPELISQYEIYYDTSNQYPFANIITIGNQQEIEIENLTENETYYFAIRSTNNNGKKGWLSDVLEIDLSVINDVKVDESLVISYELGQNYPNPFNPKTTIKFSIPKSTKVVLSVFSITGEKIRDLLKEELPSGNYEYEFDGSNLSSGIYFYQLKTADFIQTKKLVLLK